MILLSMWQWTGKHECECNVKAKCKVHPRTGYEDPKGEYRYTSTLSLTSALDGVGGQRHPRPLYPWERPGTHCIGGWVGPRAGHEECGKSRPRRDSIHGPSCDWQVSMPTELPGPCERNTQNNS